MMVKQTIISHEFVNEYVTNLKCNGAVGLILGHIANRQHLIVQLVRTPEPDNASSRLVPSGSRNESKVVGPSSEQVQVSAGAPLVNESRFMQHARCVNRMLPGGLLISGVFLFAAENVLEKEYNAARNMLTTLHTQLYAKHVSDSQIESDAIPLHEMLVLTISKTSKRFTCKLYDARDPKSVGRLVDIRFQSLANKWVRLNTILNVDLPMCTSPSNADYGDLLLGNWRRVRELFVSEMWNTRCEILVADRILLAFSQREALAQTGIMDVLQSSCDNNGCSSFHVEVLTRMSAVDQSVEPSSDLCPSSHKSESRATKLHLRGAIDSCAFLHSSATMFDTLFAIKFDIVRSFLSRGDLLIDEMQIAEREVLPSTIEQRLPIRIYIDNLLCPPLIYADFIFVHETHEDVLDRVRYYLDVSRNEKAQTRLGSSDELTVTNRSSRTGSTSSSINESPAHSLTNLVALATSLRYNSSSFVISATQPHIRFDVETPLESSEADAETEVGTGETPPEDSNLNRRASSDVGSLSDTAPCFLDGTDASECQVDPQMSLPLLARSSGISFTSVSGRLPDNGTTTQYFPLSRSHFVALSVFVAAFAISAACYFHFVA